MFVNKKGAFRQFEAGVKKESALNKSTRLFFAQEITGKELFAQKASNANMQLQYKKVLEISLSCALALIIGLSQFGRLFTVKAQTIKKIDIKIEVADIPQTQQFHRPPPPVRPSVPVPTESEEIPEDLTIGSTEIDLTELPPPPGPPEDDEMPIFVAYDEAPEIKGGMEELMKYLKYPRLAQNAGMEGIVFLKVLVSADGKTEKTEILKSTPENMGFEESAMDAVKKVHWRPAKQRDKNIRVWVSLPVQFKLVSS